MANARKTYEGTERNYSNQSRRDIHPDFYKDEKGNVYGNNEGQDERYGKPHPDPKVNKQSSLVRDEDEDRASR